MSNNVFGRRGTTVPVCAYVDGHDRQVDVIEQLIVELDGHAGGEEHHHLLFAVLLEEGEQQQESLLRGAHHVALEQIPTTNELSEGHNTLEQIPSTIELSGGTPPWNKYNSLLSYNYLHAFYCSGFRLGRCSDTRGATDHKTHTPPNT